MSNKYKNYEAGYPSSRETKLNQEEADNKILKYKKECKTKEEFTENFTSVVKSFGSFSTNPYSMRKIIALENLIDEFSSESWRFGMTQNDLADIFIKQNNKEK